MPAYDTPSRVPELWRARLRRQPIPTPTVVVVALKGAMKRFTASVHEIDRASITEFCDGCGLTPMTEVVTRQHVRVGGEVRSVRVVPRAGAPALEVTVTDGRGSVTAVFLGRRKIGGVTPGRRIAIEGVAGQVGARQLLYNPLYTLY